MSVWHDWIDWVGGWPFEVARPEAIINPLAERGFYLLRLWTVGNGWGCNEYVFRRLAQYTRPEAPIQLDTSEQKQQNDALFFHPSGRRRVAGIPGRLP